MNIFDIKNLVPIIATKEDIDFAWRYAFSFADSQLRSDDTRTPEMYAKFYTDTISGEENVFLWPDHDKIFWTWEQETRN